MKKLIFAVLLGLSFLLNPLANMASATPIDCNNPTTTKAQIQCGACTGAGTTDTTNNTCDTGSSAGGVQNTITTIINLLSVVGGVAAVIMIIVAGLRYVTSGGKEEGVKNAKNTILYAIIGLVIVALAQLIVHFVLHTTTSATDCVNGKTSTGQKCS